MMDRAIIPMTPNPIKREAGPPIARAPPAPMSLKGFDDQDAVSRPF